MSGRAFALAALGLVACTGTGIQRTDLPEEPLAFVFRTETEAQERAEVLARAEGRGEPRRRPGEGHVRLEDVGGWFGLDQSREERRAAMLGRLAFFDLRDDEISIAPFALPGARPLDWSPDHERLLLSSLRGGSQQLYEWSRSDDHLRAVTHGPAVHPTGCYGPEGRIAYVSIEHGPRGSRSRVFVAGRGGAGARPITPGPTDGAPSWAPDGSVIVYEVSPHRPNARIAVIDPEGGEPRIIARGRRPVFTPDGKWVVYSAPTSRGWRLRRMRPDGSGKMTIGGTAPGEEHAPTVSPDGRFVAYVVERGDRQQLRLRALDGSGDRPLLNHGDGISPAWN